MMCVICENGTARSGKATIALEREGATLVIKGVMDKSHRCRASAGVRAINELKPVLGLELTATPFVESSRGAVAFKNVRKRR